MLMKRTSGFWKRGLAGGGEIAVACADADDQVRLAGDPVGGQGAGDAHGAQVQRMIEPQAALAGHRLADRNAGLLDERCERLRGLAVEDAAARDDQRSFGLPNPVGGLRPAPAGPARLRGMRQTRFSKNSTG